MRQPLAKRAKLTAYQESARERDIVLACLELLSSRFRHITWIRCEPATAVKMALKGSGRMRGGAWLDGAWSNGISDIIGLNPKGPDYCFEVKRPGGKQRQSQLEFEVRATNGGHIYRIIYSAADAVAVVNEVEHGR